MHTNNVRQTTRNDTTEQNRSIKRDWYFVMIFSIKTPPNMQQNCNRWNYTMWLLTMNKTKRPSIPGRRVDFLGQENRQGVVFSGEVTDFNLCTRWVGHKLDVLYRQVFYACECYIQLCTEMYRSGTRARNHNRIESAQNIAGTKIFFGCTLISSFVWSHA